MGGEREKHWFVVPLTYPFTGCLLYVPWLGTEPSTLEYWDDALNSSATQPGPGVNSFKIPRKERAVKVNGSGVLWYWTLSSEYTYQKVFNVHLYQKFYLIFNPQLRICLLTLERRKGREREKHWLAASCVRPCWRSAHNLLVCGMTLQPIEPPGHLAVLGQNFELTFPYGVFHHCNWVCTEDMLFLKAVWSWTLTSDSFKKNTVNVLQSDSCSILIWIIYTASALLPMFNFTAVSPAQRQLNLL